VKHNTLTDSISEDDSGELMFVKCRGTFLYIYIYRKEEEEKVAEAQLNPNPSA
jgi:hypothetical protein